MWDWAVWGAFVLAFSSAIAGLVLVVLRLDNALRAGRSAHSGAVERLGALEAKVQLTTTKASAAGDTRELQESLARLRWSLARLAVLRAAVGRAEEQLSWVRALL